MQNLYGASLSYSTFINGTLLWWWVCGPFFSLSCLFLSECQLLRNPGGKKKNTTIKQRKRKKKKKPSVFVYGCYRNTVVCSLLPTSTVSLDLHSYHVVDSLWSSLNYQLDTIQREPRTQTSGSSRDAIFSWLHFDNLGDSIFISTLQKALKQVLF